MTTNDDDFWGNQADWPELPEADRKPPRRSAGARVSGWWNQVVGGGVEGTRHHGGKRTSSAGMANGSTTGDIDADDFDLDADDPIPTPPAGTPRTPTREAPTEIADETWDDEWIVEPAPTPSPGVDPLLARLGGLAIVTTLLVPLVLTLGSRGDDSTATDTTTAAVSVVAPAEATTPSTSSAAPTEPVTTSAASPGEQSADSTSVVPTATPPESSTPATDDAAAVADQSTTEQVSAELTTAAVATEEAERAQSCAIDYEVVAGDFWIRLADAAGIPLDELLDANDATVDTPLYPGATICLPDGVSVPAPPTTAAPVTTPPATPEPTTPATTAKPATTTAPTTSPATTAKPVVTYPTISAAAAEQIIRDVWPDELEDRAIEIARRESNLVVTAKNSCCYGLFQINWNPHKSWLAGLGVTSPEQLFDATTNAYAAYALYQASGGWGPWT